MIFKPKNEAIPFATNAVCKIHGGFIFIFMFDVWLTPALGEVIGSHFVPDPAGAVKATRMVHTQLLTPSVGEVPALIHIWWQMTVTIRQACYPSNALSFNLAAAIAFNAHLPPGKYKMEERLIVAI